MNFLHHRSTSLRNRKNKQARILSIMLCLLCIPFITSAQYFSKKLLGGKEMIEIPFEYQQGFIIMDVRFQRTLPLKFIFDTGAEHTLLLKKIYTDILGIPYHREIKVIGSDLTTEISGLICRNIYLGLKNASVLKQDILVLEEDLYLLDELTGLKIDGILGANMFRNLVVSIDYQKEKITLWDPEKFKEPKGFEKLDLTINKNKPYLDCAVSLQPQTSTKATFLLDTGASIHFLLHTNTDTSFHLPSIFAKGNIGHGLGGAIEGYLGMVYQMDVGKTKFKQVVISFQDVDTSLTKQKQFIRNGIIGNKLLERFIVTIDYAHSKLYLKAKRKVDQIFRYDKSGLSIYALGANHKEFYIKDVIKGSPAEKAGLKIGDVIYRFQRVPSKYMGIGRIFHVLSGRSGKKIKIKVIRADQKLTFKFRLEDFLFKGLDN